MSAFMPVHYVGTSYARPNGHAGPESLGEAHDICLNTFMMVECEHLSGSPHPGLYLVHEQHDSVLVTDTPELFHELLRRSDVTTFALYYFQDDSRNLFRRRRGFEKTILDPVYDVATDGLFIGRQVIREMPEGVWIWHMYHIECLPHEP